MSITLGIVEDHTLARQRLLEHMRLMDEVQVTVAAASGQAFLNVIDGLPEADRPQAVLMDIQMPGLSGVETTRQLKARYPEVEVLMLTMFEHDEAIFDSIQAGASGYLLKGEPVDVIVDAVVDLMAGGAPVSPAIARKVLNLIRQGAAKPGAPSDLGKQLTSRELDVLHLVVSGKTNREIAETLFLSPLTVKTHVKNIYRKLQVHSRAGVTQAAYKHRLIE
ncbi:MAG: response regulator transcription factor [Bacteroidota bacterium]